MKDKITVKNLLKKYDFLDKEVVVLNNQLGILGHEANYLLLKLSRSGVITLPSNFSEISELEVATLILELIKRCDVNNPNYNKTIAEEMIRIGFETSKFYGGHNHNKWNTGTFQDDGFGFGTEPLSLYDDYIDSQWEDESSKKR